MRTRIASDGVAKLPQIRFSLRHLPNSKLVSSQILNIVISLADKDIMGRLLRTSLFILIASAMLPGCSKKSDETSAASSSPVASKQVYDSARQVYHLQYSLTLQATVDFVELREIDLSVDSTVNCEAGVPIKNWNSPFQSGEVIKGEYLAGGEAKFRYLLCLRNTEGVTTEYSETAQ